MIYTFEFRNPFLSFRLQNIILAAQFVNFHTYISGQKCLARLLNELTLIGFGYSCYIYTRAYYSISDERKDMIDLQRL